MKITNKMRLDWLLRHDRPSYVGGFYYFNLLGPFRTEIDCIDAAILSSARKWNQ